MKRLRIIHTIILVILGALSVFMSTSVAFDLFGIREMEGNYVPFILYTNMACGYLYLFAAYMNWKSLAISARTLLIATLALITAFVFFSIYIEKGGVYELKTVKAMVFRTVITAVLTASAFYMHKFSSEE